MYVLSVARNGLERFPDLVQEKAEERVMVYSEDKLCRPSNFDCVQQYSAIASLHERGITAGRK